MNARELLVRCGPGRDPTAALDDTRGEQRIAHGLGARRSLGVARRRPVFDKDVVEDEAQHG